MNSGSTLGMKVWILYVAPDATATNVSAVPFATLERLQEHYKELKEKRPHLQAWYDTRPEVVL